MKKLCPPRSIRNFNTGEEGMCDSRMLRRGTHAVGGGKCCDNPEDVCACGKKGNRGRRIPACVTGRIRPVCSGPIAFHHGVYAIGVGPRRGRAVHMHSILSGTSSKYFVLSCLRLIPVNVYNTNNVNRSLGWSGAGDG